MTSIMPMELWVYGIVGGVGYFVARYMDKKLAEEEDEDES